MGTFNEDFILAMEGMMFHTDTFAQEVICLIPGAPSPVLKAIVNKKSFNLDTELEGYGSGLLITVLSKQLPNTLKKNDEFSVEGRVYRLEEVLSRTPYFTRILLRLPHGKRL